MIFVPSPTQILHRWLIRSTKLVQYGRYQEQYRARTGLQALGRALGLKAIGREQARSHTAFRPRAEPSA